MNRFNAPDGTSLVFDAYEPARPKAAVLFFHGWSDHAGRFLIRQGKQTKCRTRK